MAVDNTILFIITILSGIPLFILGIAELITTHYERKGVISTSEKPSKEIPWLVKLHIRTTRSVAVCAITTFSTLAILFIVPLLVIWFLWPEDILSVAYSLISWGFIASIFGILRVGCTSPGSLMLESDVDN